MKLNFKAVSLIGCAAAAGPVAAQSFSPPNFVSGPGSFTDLVTLDLDGDGDLDLISNSASSGGGIFFTENLDTGGLGTPQPLTPTLVFPRNFDVVDLDLDGQEDLVVALGGSFGSVVWFKGLQFGAFGPQQTIGNLADSLDVACADFDLDGDVDVGVAVGGNSLGAHTVQWFENSGAGMSGFEPPALISGNLISVVGLETADLNDDGRPDLVSASELDDKVAWYESLASGGFSGQRVITTGAEDVQDVHLADVDQDGLIDVLSASEGDGEVAIFINQGGGIFASQPLLDAGNGAVFSVTTADVDLDGDIDVIAGDGGCSNCVHVRYYENVGFGFFAAPVLLNASGSRATGVAALDLDGDSDIDIATSDIVWFANTAVAGTIYCTSTANSTGLAGTIAATGSPVSSINLLTLSAEDLPNNSFGFFLTSMLQGVVNQPGGSQGTLCLSGGIGRYVGPGQIQFSAGTGAFRLSIDLTQTPTPQTGLVPVMAGQTWNFQAWYRDVLMGVATSNFTDAVTITFS